MSSLCYFWIATSLEFLAGCGCLVLSHKDFKKCKRDVSTQPEVKTRARIERIFAFFFFTASVVTGIGLYVNTGEQRAAESSFGVVTSQVSTLSTKLQKAEKDLESEKYKLANAKGLVLPRVLSPEQKAKMIESARRFSSVDVLVEWTQTDSEASDFGTDLSDTLTEAGWKVTRRPEIPFFAGGGPPKGIIISVHMWPYLPAQSLAESLVASGMSVGMMTNSPGSFSVWIGPKTNP